MLCRQNRSLSLSFCGRVMEGVMASLAAKPFPDFRLQLRRGGFSQSPKATVDDDKNENEHHDYHHMRHAETETFPFPTLIRPRCLLNPTLFSPILQLRDTGCGGARDRMQPKRCVVVTLESVAILSAVACHRFSGCDAWNDNGIVSAFHFERWNVGAQTGRHASRQ